MAKIQCKMCGGDLTLPENALSGTCEYCGSVVTFPKIATEQQERLYNRAEHFRRVGEFDKALRSYTQLAASSDDPEVYWGLVLSRYGIEYVEDPASHERIPTCHRVSGSSVLTDADYLTALDNAGSCERELYEKEARRIEAIRKDILAISAKEQPFDVFICYKESDEDGRRTRDSVAAQELYYELTEAGYKVFFARITLENKLGQQYEPYIFAALNSAKAMLVIGSKPEYFNAVWVRNEWSRYLELMKSDRHRLLIPCFRDMDAYDIPEELSLFQAQDMSKLGFVQDLLRGLKKLLTKKRGVPEEPPAAVSAASGTDENPLLVRAQLFVETGDFDSARQYCERVLDVDPRNGYAYFCRMMAELKVSEEAALVDVDGLYENKSFLLAQKFADGELLAKIDRLKKLVEERERKAEEERERKAEEERKAAEEKRKSEHRVPPEQLDIYDHVLFGLRNRGRLRTANEVVIPDTVTRIGHSAFLDCSFLQSVVIPDSVTEIGMHAFCGCSSLQSVVIPDSVTKIENSAFCGCSNLQSVVIPASVTQIEDFTFSDCFCLQSVVIPDSVTKIKTEAFSGCFRLGKVKIGNETLISRSAFAGAPCQAQIAKEHKDHLYIDLAVKWTWVVFAVAALIVICLAFGKII